jgi:YHS domain-containing protein
MLLTTIALLTVGFGQQDKAPLVCPMMGSEIHADSPAVDYNGVRYQFCCAGCDSKFMANPTEALKAEMLKDKMVGVGLFDPVSGKRITEKKAKGSSDFAGVRFYFESEANKATFDAEPKKYGTAPKNEVMVCPVMGKKVTYATADSYVDYNGVRYYACCGGCSPMLKQDASKFASGVAKSVQAPKAVKAPKKG